MNIAVEFINKTLINWIEWIYGLTGFLLGMEKQVTSGGKIHLDYLLLYQVNEEKPKGNYNKCQ